MVSLPERTALPAGYSAGNRKNDYTDFLKNNGSHTCYTENGINLTHEWFLKGEGNGLN